MKENKKYMVSRPKKYKCEMCDFSSNEKEDFVKTEDKLWLCRNCFESGDMEKRSAEGE